jgi:phosphatidylglycerol:prolipoprotein diacylglycerol transferase
MLPKLISIDGFFLPTYGLLVSLGFLAGILLAMRLARRDGLSAEKVGNLTVYCALIGLAGAKLMMFAFNFRYYIQYPGELFSFSTLLSAGVYYGGFLAALAFAWFYIRAQKMPWLRTADVVAPGLALGHTIGRLGCFAAGCCWGSRCDLPWAVTFTNPAAHDITGVPLHVPLHPAQLYEAALTALVAWILYRRSLKPHPPGWILALYLLLYSPARLFVEFFREHDQPPPLGGPLTWTQWIAVALTGVGIWLAWRVWRGAPGRHLPDLD